ncbi:MAG: hypothetical protein WD275_06835 [Rhodothermales bacterium]
MIRGSILIALVVAVAGWGMLFSSVRLSMFTVDAENSDLIIKWQANVEEEVAHYQVKRLTRLDNDFVEIAKIPAQGANKLYVFRDDKIYKTAAETVEYELVAVSADGRTEISLGRRQTAYTPTAVRRTWGSIKAMFQ